TDIGVDDEVGSKGSVVFQIWVDAVKLYDSGVLTGKSPTQIVSVDVHSRQTLELVVTNGGDNNSYDHADWASARLVQDSVAPPSAGSLPGTPFGTAGSWGNSGNTFNKVFDSNTATYFDAPVADGA